MVSATEPNASVVKTKASALKLQPERRGGIRGGRVRMGDRGPKRDPQPRGPGFGENVTRRDRQTDATAVTDTNGLFDVRPTRE
jgi:hypothetical protein